MTAPASRRRSAPLAGALFLFVCSCGGSNGVAPTTTAPAPPPAVPAVGPFFEDVTAASGITHTYRCGEEAGHYSILESLGGGAALIDYDGDGLLDAFLPGGGYFDGPNKQEIKGHPCRLYKNLGGLKFKDVSQEAGVGVVTHYTHGAAVGDYDKDGWPDLVVTGWGKLALLRNEADGKGGRRFADVTTKAGLTDDSWSVSAGWADFDGDGHPDLYACHYVNWRFGSDKTHPTNCNYDGKTRDVCPPKSFHPLPHIVYRNNGDGTFADVSKAAGLRMPRAPGDYAPLKAALKAEALASARMGPLTKLRLREEAARRLRKARGLSEFERPAPEAEKEMRAQAEKEVEAMPAEAFAKEVEGDIERSAEDAMARLLSQGGTLIP